MHLLLVNNAYVDGVGARQDTASAEEEVEEVNGENVARKLCDKPFWEREISVRCATQRLSAPTVNSSLFIQPSTFQRLTQSLRKFFHAHMMK